MPTDHWFTKATDMTAENFTNVLDGLRQMQPFHIFTVELHGGRRFEVDHPGALVVRDGVAVFLAPGGMPIWFDHESVNQIFRAPVNTEVDERGTLRRSYATKIGI